MDGFSNVAPVTELSNGNTSVRALNPEHANQFEVGTKLNLFDDKLSATLSYYDITVSDMAQRIDTDADNLVYLTQTTLSMDDANVIIEAIKKRFPNVKAPPSEDICYATTNRQNAVKHIAPQCDIVLVVGAENSSNSKRLVEVATRAGAASGRLVADRSAIDWDEIDAASHIGLSAGASAPESLVHEIIDEMRERYDLQLDEDALVEETMSFKLPPILTRQA